MNSIANDVWDLLMDQCINKSKFDFQAQFNSLKKQGFMRFLQESFRCPDSRGGVKATVGEIRINACRAQDRLLLLESMKAWLETNDWSTLVSISTRTCSRIPAIEFCPGEFQSNGHRKIFWDDRSSVDEVIMALEDWLTNVEAEA
jgi:hypothetical protein